MIDLDFEKAGGLIPAIAQDYKTGEVLMMAFINEESWKLSLETSIVHYWSRSRNKLWKKGESSGNMQMIKDIRVDCDNDCVLFVVDQIGDAACHTGYKSCFYRKAENGQLVTDGEKVFDPEKVYGGS